MYSNARALLKLIRQFERLGRALLKVPDLKFQTSTSGDWVLKINDTPLGADYVGPQLEAFKIVARFRSGFFCDKAKKNLLQTVPFVMENCETPTSNVCLG